MRWLKEGLMRGGHVFEPTNRWVPAIAGNDGSVLPTPVVNDMGRGKTVEWWDAWIVEQREKHRNGNGHGKSLSIEVRRLLPTPTAQDGANNAGPSQWNRNSDPLNVVAAKLGGETMPTPSPDGSGPVDGAPPPQ